MHLQLEIKPGVLPDGGAGHHEGGVHGGQLDALPGEGGVQVDTPVSSYTEPSR